MPEMRDIWVGAVGAGNVRLFTVDVLDGKMIAPVQDYCCTKPHVVFTVYEMIQFCILHWDEMTAMILHHRSFCSIINSLCWGSDQRIEVGRRMMSFRTSAAI